MKLQYLIAADDEGDNYKECYEMHESAGTIEQDMCLGVVKPQQCMQKCGLHVGADQFDEFCEEL